MFSLANRAEQHKRIANFRYPPNLRICCVRYECRLSGLICEPMGARKGNAMRPKVRAYLVVLNELSLRVADGD